MKKETETISKGAKLGHISGILKALMNVDSIPLLVKEDIKKGIKYMEELKNEYLDSPETVS